MHPRASMPPNQATCMKKKSDLKGGNASKGLLLATQVTARNSGNAKGLGHPRRGPPSLATLVQFSSLEGHDTPPSQPPAHVFSHPQIQPRAQYGEQSPPHTKSLAGLRRVTPTQPPTHKFSHGWTLAPLPGERAACRPTPRRLLYSTQPPRINYPLGWSVFSPSGKCMGGMANACGGSSLSFFTLKLC